MRQSELSVGKDYALPIHRPQEGEPLAARVRVVSVDGGGKATVEVVDPGGRQPENARGALILKRGERTQIQVRVLAVAWEAWEAEVAAAVAEQKELAAERLAREEERSRADADRTHLDPDRELPAAYEDDDPWWASHREPEDREKLAEEFVAGLHTGWPVEQGYVLALLANLPVPVARDVSAAGWRETGQEGTVRRTYARAALMLHQAFEAGYDKRPYVQRHLTQPFRILQDNDAAFVKAVADSFEAEGGQLLLPYVPPLPDWIDEDLRRLVGRLGWLRVAIGDTTGTHLHEPGCPSFRSQAEPLDGAEHRPWWLVLLERRSRLCGRCDGPALRDLVALIGFLAASDVWQARGFATPEGWQRRAVLHLISASAEARASIVEPDVTLAATVVAALASEAPGRDGWAAYYLVLPEFNYLAREGLAVLDRTELEAARTLARDRLAVTAAALPASRRLLPLPKRADASLLRERYGALKSALSDVVPNLDRLLFTLPDAMD